MLAHNTFLNKTFPYSPYYFSIWRILFGTFLTFYSIAVLPYVGYLYSNTGIYENYHVLPFFPNILALYDGVPLVYGMSIVAVLCSFCILLGYKRAYAALLLGYITVCFFGRNILTEDPSFAFVAMLLFLLALIPSGEPLSLDFHKNQKKQTWYMPYFVYMTMLVTIGLGFSISGIDKLQGYGWQIGDAMYYLYDLRLAYDSYLVDFLRNSPAWSIQLQSAVAMSIMLIALPGLLLKQVRSITWFLLFGMFSFVLVTMDLKQVVFGVLLADLFIFDNRWIRGLPAIHVELFYDTSCKLCTKYKLFIETEDQKQVTHFDSITNVPQQHQTTEDSIVLVVDGRAYYKSDAVIQHFRLLGGIWRLVALCGIWIPKKMRDTAYDFVARNRYQWFGSCDCAIK